MHRKIVILDDSKTSRLFVQQALEIAGFTPENITQYDSSVKLLQSLESGDTVDILVTDINMPEMNGIDLIGQINAKNLKRNMKIVVISSTQTDSREKELKDLGVSFCLAKPIDMPKLLKSFTELFQS